jgi:hypothetical protein
MRIPLLLADLTLIRYLPFYHQVVASSQPQLTLSQKIQAKKYNSTINLLKKVVLLSREKSSFNLTNLLTSQTNQLNFIRFFSKDNTSMY